MMMMILMMIFGMGPIHGVMSQPAPLKYGSAQTSTALTFNWLAPKDERCYGPLHFETFEPDYSCYKWEMGIEQYDVRAA